MSFRSRRLAVAAVIAATAIAAPAAALASVSGTSPSADSSTPAASKSPAGGAPAGGAAAASKSAARQSGAPDRVSERAMVAALAARLGVSNSAAQRAFNQLGALDAAGGVDPASPAFVSIAHDLGVSPAQLAAALVAAKQAARQAAAGS
jgi:hypothetical protein